MKKSKTKIITIIGLYYSCPTKGLINSIFYDGYIGKNTDVDTIYTRYETRKCRFRPLPLLALTSTVLGPAAAAAAATAVNSRVPASATISQTKLKYLIRINGIIRNR